MGKQSKDDDYSQTQPQYFNNIFQSSLEVSLEFFGAEYCFSKYRRLICFQLFMQPTEGKTVILNLIHFFTL